MNFPFCSFIEVRDVSLKRSQGNCARDWPQQSPILKPARVLPAGRLRSHRGPPISHGTLWALTMVTTHPHPLPPDSPDHFSASQLPSHHPPRRSLPCSLLSPLHCQADTSPALRNQTHQAAWSCPEMLESLAPPGNHLATPPPPWAHLLRVSAQHSQRPSDAK